MCIRDSLNGTRGVVLGDAGAGRFEFKPTGGSGLPAKHALAVAMGTHGRLGTGADAHCSVLAAEPGLVSMIVDMCCRMVVGKGDSLKVKLENLQLTNALDAAVRHAGGGARWEDADTVFATPDRTLLKMTEVAQRMFGWDGTLWGSVCRRGVCAAAIADLVTDIQCRLQGEDVEAGTEYDAQPSFLDVFVVAADEELDAYEYSGRHGRLRRHGWLRLDTGEQVQGLSTQPLPKGGQYLYFASRDQMQDPLKMPIRFVEGGQAGFEAERDKFVHEAAMRYCVEPPVTRTLEIEGEKMLEIEVVVHKFYDKKHTHTVRATKEEVVAVSRGETDLGRDVLGLDDGRCFEKDDLEERVTMQPLHLLGVCLTDREWRGQWPDMMYVQIIRKTSLSRYLTAQVDRRG